MIHPVAQSTLSFDQFAASVLDANPQVAVFDCDGTLWSGDAGSGFMAWCQTSAMLSPESQDWLEERYAGYALGDVSEAAICGNMVQVFAGIPEADIRVAASEFFRARIEPGIFAEMKQVLQRLQERKVDIWAVSSTCNWVIEEGVRELGIPANRVLAARVEIAGGLATDRVLDVPTDVGKVAALARAGVTEPDVVFGNSIHDAAMLAIARQPFSVNPTPALLEKSAVAQWPVFFPS